MAQKKNKTLGFFKRIFNFRLMLDWDRIKGNADYIKDKLKTYFILKEPTTTESFENAQTQLNLSDQDLLKKQQALLLWSIVMVVAAIGSFSYAIYHLIYSTLLGAVPALTLSFVALAFAFRYHFWHMQIKNRKLGLTLNDWLNRDRGLKGK